MQQPTATMAAPQPFNRRMSGSFPSDFPVGADPRLIPAHTYAPHHGHPVPPHASDPASNYQYTSGRAPFDHQLPFDGASGSNVASWFYGDSQAPTSQGVGEPSLPYHLDAYAQHAPAATSTHISAPHVAPINANSQGHASGSAPPQANFASKSAPLGSAEAASFAVGISGHAAPSSSLAAASHPHVAAVPLPLSDRRASDENAHLVSTGLSLSEAGSSVANGPIHGNTQSAPESVGLNGSISPNSSARASSSPEGIHASQPYQAYSSANVPPLGGMVMGAPISAAMMDSIDSWLAPAAPSASIGAIPSSAPAAPLVAPANSAKLPATSKRNISPTQASAPARVPSSSSRFLSDASFHPGSSINGSESVSGAPFKTSTERRERNKASQRESRKRKQDRLETLESENASLRKALADMKKFSQALSNGAGIRGEDGAEVEAIQLTKFTGAFHLDLIESHLDDESAEAEWKGMIGRRFPASTLQATDWDGVFPAMASSTSESDEDNAGQGQDSVKSEGKAAPAAMAAASSSASSQSASERVKKAMWEISLNQKRHKAAQTFPSMVAVPELVLYKVCRLYFSTLLPFTTKVKSGIINLRAAREAPGFMGGYDDLPRFPGDPAIGAADLYLPKNLMPTEMQMRIGFHPIEIAVMPYPAMRDRILTILSAFHAIEELAAEEEAAASRFSEDPSRDASPSGSGNTQQHDANSKDDPNAELIDGDIRKRTALVADMSAWKPKDYNGAVVVPDKARVYSYGYVEKPRGSHRLRKPAQRWLDEFFYEVVQTLRVWSPAGDVFDGECFEFKESFFRKYPYMVDGEILRATNRWRRARGEDSIRL